MSPRPDAVLITRDFELVSALSEAAPEVHADWRQTFTSGLTGITPETRLLVVDADAGAPMAFLLASLFLDQHPGRTALVVQGHGTPARACVDPRVEVVERPFDASALRSAIDEASAMSAACEEIEKLARLGAAIATAPPAPRPAAVVAAT